MSDPSSSKRCTKCGAVKSCAEFSRNARTKDGLQYWCKSCLGDARRAWRAANAERDAKYSADYYAANRERVAANQRALREADPERWRSMRRAQAAGQRQAHRAREVAKSRKWQKANPEKVREIGHRRRARMAGLVATPVDLSAIPSRVCGICSEPLDASLTYPDPLSRSLDHILPLARGGPHSQMNLQWAHLICNNRKGATAPD